MVELEIDEPDPEIKEECARNFLEHNLIEYAGENSIENNSIIEKPVIRLINCGGESSSYVKCNKPNCHKEVGDLEYCEEHKNEGRCGEPPIPEEAIKPEYRGLSAREVVKKLRRENAVDDEGGHAGSEGELFADTEQIQPDAWLVEGKRHGYTEFRVNRPDGEKYEDCDKEPLFTESRIQKQIFEMSEFALKQWSPSGDLTKQYGDGYIDALSDFCKQFFGMELSEVREVFDQPLSSGSGSSSEGGSS